MRSTQRGRCCRLPGPNRARSRPAPPQRRGIERSSQEPDPERLARALRALALLRAQATGDIHALALASGLDVQFALGLEFGPAAYVEAASSDRVRRMKEETAFGALRDAYLGMNDVALAMATVLSRRSEARGEQFFDTLESVLRQALVD